VNLDKPWLVVHPGATAPSRRYPPEQYGAVVRQLVRDSGMQVVLTGASAELELVASVQDAAQVETFSVAGKLTLAELGAVIELAPLLITNNTGPAHIAAALGTPVVDLYALTNAQHTPWGVPHRVLFHDVPCRFCYKSICPEGHHNCMRQVAQEEVVRAAEELYGLKGAPILAPTNTSPLSFLARLEIPVGAASEAGALT
jgi:ADP-heptose:LPS heptosyltransferase